MIRRTLMAAVLVSALAASCADAEPERDTAADSAALAAVFSSNVLYRVTGTAQGADLTVVNAEGQIEQASDSAVPVRSDGHLGIDMGRFRSGSVASISAQNTGSTGDLHCEIRADGTVIAEADSVGGFSIVTCRATVP